MPTYVYKCTKCDQSQELFLPVEHSAPECCSKPMAKIPCTTAFALKGGGWFKDSYSGPSNKKKN
jgi:putative FmdB family regulatory protein